MKKDITQNVYYVKQLFDVVKGRHQNAGKSRYISARHCDAFTYTLTGTSRYQFEDGTEFTVRAGEIMFITRDARYTVEILEAPYEFIFCDFWFDGEEARKCSVCSPGNREYAEHLFTKLLRTYGNPSGIAVTECMSILYEIYRLILTTANREYLARSSRDKIEEIKEAIDANYKNTSLSISSLARDAGMSEVHLRKLFKARYDICPSQYMISVRLGRAKELMKYPFLTLEECALQSGFSSLSYFCRVFKKVMGITPLQYRAHC